MTPFDAAPLSTFFDGARARAYQVNVWVEGAHLHISNPAGHFSQLSWPLKSLARLREYEQDTDPGAWHIAPTGSEARLIVRSPDLQKQIAGAAGGRFIASRWRRLQSLLFRYVLPAAALLVAFYFGVEILARWAVPFVPHSFERALGESIRENLGSIIQDAKICDRREGGIVLEKIASDFAKKADLPFPLTIEVVQNDRENAFAIPGGYVVIFDGLLKKADKPELIAGVLAHEIGHVAHRHGMQGLLQSTLVWGVIAVIIGDMTSIAPIFVAAIVNSAYSRKMESEADLYALRLMESLRLNPEPFAAWFEKMAEKEEGGMLTYFSTHPAPAERARLMRGAAGGKSESWLRQEEWSALRSICQKTSSEKR